MSVNLELTKEPPLEHPYDFDICVWVTVSGIRMKAMRIGIFQISLLENSYYLGLQSIYKPAMTQKVLRELARYFAAEFSDYEFVAHAYKDSKRDKKFLEFFGFSVALVTFNKVQYWRHKK